ncbi:KAP family P-loop domain protein [Prevotella sp. oral taxon 472 str. F0295]|nr:KAP family P-loop domain protein [Prevotella sp. oral taxon 472 str. F0295]
MWPDKETEIDYLNFGYMVDLIADIATNRELSPSTIGLYGDWGSGKSSLMKLVQKKIEEKYPKNEKKKDTVKTLCIEFNGWLFEGYEDTKTSLCGAILDALADKKRFSKEVTDYAKELIKKIDINKILGKGVKYGLDLFLSGGIGILTDLSLSSLLSTIKSNAGEVQAKDIEEILSMLKKNDKTRTEIKNFRNEFKDLLKKSKVENVVVFIDELDRCLPDTVLEVFEAMRLFLFVEGMSFVIGADERLIQYSIKSKYKEVPGNNLDIGKEYLEKVIQYPLYIPQLTRAEVNQYLACLLLKQTLSDEKFKEILGIVYTLTPDQDFSMDLISDKAPDLTENCKQEMALARQISSVLAPSINGNPRQCKRFLNTLYMRLKLAEARNVILDKNILAKLMLAEYFNPEFFKAVTKPENRELFKDFEKGEVLNDENPFAVWKEKDWVKKWMQNDTRLENEKLDKYVYFSDIKNRYGQSNLDLLSPTARKCYELLVDGTEINRNNALNYIDKLASGERAVIASEVFAVIENKSTMNVEVLRSYTEFCIKTGMKEEALKKLMEQPVSKYNAIAYGQLTPFISKLSPDEATRFNDYLSTNIEVKNTIQRQEKLNSIIPSNKK